MIIKRVIEEDFTNYKKPSMFIAFPNCTFKCEKESEVRCCQNSGLAKEKNIDVNEMDIIERYITNPIPKALVCGGLEPFDSWNDLKSLIDSFRKHSDDDVIIYTGYNKDEITNKVNELKQYHNIIIKFGRYIPNQEVHYDEVLGVSLASSNQYGMMIS